MKQSYFHLLKHCNMFIIILSLIQYRTSFKTLPVRRFGSILITTTVIYSNWSRHMELSGDIWSIQNWAYSASEESIKIGQTFQGRHKWSLWTISHHKSIWICCALSLSQSPCGSICNRILGDCFTGNGAVSINKIIPKNISFWNVADNKSTLI